ncbi:MAG: hypothetical protein M1839_004001 [Geoglossum umbratile]|nr:MAG: hypothetical protein M1839_004001 [Geoglossum umbratile]
MKITAPTAFAAITLWGLGQPSYGWIVDAGCYDTNQAIGDTVTAATRSAFRMAKTAYSQMNRPPNQRIPAFTNVLGYLFGDPTLAVQEVGQLLFNIGMADTPGTPEIRIYCTTGHLRWYENYQGRGTNYLVDRIGFISEIWIPGLPDMVSQCDIHQGKAAFTYYSERQRYSAIVLCPNFIEYLGTKPNKGLEQALNDPQWDPSAPNHFPIDYPYLDTTILHEVSHVKLDSSSRARALRVWLSTVNLSPS